MYIYIGVAPPCARRCKAGFAAGAIHNSVASNMRLVKLLFAPRGGWSVFAHCVVCECVLKLLCSRILCSVYLAGVYGQSSARFFGDMFGVVHL